jgi:hypothetical protein
VLFRWHLGVREGVTVTTGSDGFPVACWAHARLAVTADCPVRMKALPMPDHTLRVRERDDFAIDYDDDHMCLVVHTVEAVTSARLHVAVDADPRAGESGNC